VNPGSIIKNPIYSNITDFLAKYAVAFSNSFDFLKRISVTRHVFLIIFVGIGIFYYPAVKDSENDPENIPLFVYCFDFLFSENYPEKSTDTGVFMCPHLDGLNLFPI
jgi:hypothetical protein